MKLPLARSDWKQPKLVADTKPRRERPRLLPDVDLPVKPHMEVLVRNGYMYRRRNKFKYDWQFYQRDLRIAEAKRCAEALLRAAFFVPDLSHKLRLTITRTELHALAERFMEVTSGARWPR